MTRNVLASLLTAVVVGAAVHFGAYDIAVGTFVWVAVFVLWELYDYIEDDRNGTI